MNFFIKIIAIVGVVALLSGGLYFLKRESRPQAVNASDIERPRQNYRVPVSAAIAEKRNLILYISTTGVAEAEQKIALIAEISGKLKELHIQAGDKVEAGRLLVEIEDETYRLDYEQARSLFIKAYADYLAELRATAHSRLDEWENYIKRFLFNKTITKLPETKTLQEEVMLIRANVKERYWGLKKSAMVLNKCKIRAPFSGTVSEVRAHKGAYIAIGTVLFELLSLDSMKVKTVVLESDVPFIRTGSHAKINFPALSGPLFDGTVISVDPVIRSEEKAGTAYIRFTNPNEKIKDGSFAEVYINKMIYQNLLLVPRDAVLFRNDRQLVFVIKEGIAKWEYVRSGRGNDEWVEIENAIQPGDTVVIGGHYALAHDVPVKIIEFTNSAAP